MPFLQRSRLIVVAVVASALVVIAIVLTRSARSDPSEAVEIVLDADPAAGADQPITDATDDACARFGSLCGAEVVAICRTPTTGRLCRLPLDATESRPLGEASNVGWLRVDPNGEAVAFSDFGATGTSPSHAIVGIDGVPLVEDLDGAPILWKNAQELIIERAPGFAVVDLTGGTTDVIESLDADAVLLRTMRPDGKALLATVTGFEGSTGGQQLWEYTFDDQTWRPLYQGPDWLPLGWDPGVAYSPDGATAYTQVTTESSRLASSGPFVTNIIAIDRSTLDTEVEASVTHTGLLGFALGRDGRAMAIRSADSLVVLDVGNGSTSNHLHLGPAPAYPGLVWSPDNEHLVVDTFVDGAATLVRIDVAEALHLQTPERLIARGTAEATAPQWVGG